MEKEIKEIKNSGSNVALIIALIVILCLVGYICYDKILAPADKKNNSATNQVEESKNTVTDASSNSEVSSDSDESVKSSVVSSEKYCEGEYYWEKYEEKDGHVIDSKVTYYLKKDGTYTADFSGVSGTKGVYVINDNTLTLIGLKETAGPRDQVPYYGSSDYIVADDCSYFTIEDFKAVRK